jgi:hypothetical protein
VADEILNIVVRMNAAIMSDRIRRTAITTVLSKHKARIFQAGLDADDAKIGTYSRKLISIPKKKQARDTGHTIFPGGYDQYKSEIGKNPGYVNLQNFGHMMADYGLIQSGPEYGLGFQNPDNYKKSIDLQDKYNKSIFAHSGSEIKLLVDTLTFELGK